jgi:hypothetical protein
MSAKAFWVSQDGHLCAVIQPASYSAAIAGKRFSMAEWAHVSILLALGASGGPIGAITVNVYNAETGGSGVAIGYRLIKYEQGSAPFDVQTNNAANNNTAVFNVASTGYTPGSSIADSMYIIELDAADLLAANNGTYVEVDIAVGSLGTTAQLLAGLAVLSSGRITGDQTASVQV